MLNGFVGDPVFVYFIIFPGIAPARHGRHVERLPVGRAPIIGWQPRSWQEQNRRSISASAEQATRIHPTTQVRTFKFM